MAKKPIEYRVFNAKPEVRNNPDGTVGIRGYFAVWDYEAHGEVIRRGAFDRTIAQRDDIRLLVNHEGIPLARTKSGTLTLGTDDYGAWFDAPSLDVANSQSARDLVSAMSRGDIDQCSFAGYFSDRQKDGLREVFEVKGVDVSVVTMPWYEATSATLTGRSTGDLEVDRALVSLRSLTPEQREMALGALPLGGESTPERVAAREAAKVRVSRRTAPAGQMSWSDVAGMVTEALDAKHDEWCFIEDIGDDWVVYEVYPDWCCYWMASWSIDANGVVTIGEPTQVVETYVPATDPAAAASATRAEVSAPRLYTIAEARALLAPAAA